MTTLYLRAKAWQLFLFFFVAGLPAAVILTRLTLSDLRIPFAYSVGTEVLYACVALWLWTLGDFLDSHAKPMLRLNRRRFRLCLIFPVFYLPVFEALWTRLTRDPALFASIFPVHIFAVFCGFYAYYFVSKSLALVEKNRPVSYPDYVGYLLAFWFLIFGIWFIQPRINRLYASAMQPLSS